MAGQAAFKAYVDIPVLVGLDPRLGLHIRFADHRSRLHGGMNFVTGAVKKPGIDKDDAVRGGADTLFEVNRGAPFLVHDADLHGFWSHT